MYPLQKHNIPYGIAGGVLGAGLLGFFTVKLYRSWSKSHPVIPKISAIDTLRFTIFNETNLLMGSAYDTTLHNCKKYTISSDNGETIVNNEQVVFRGGLSLTARKVEVFIQENPSKLYRVKFQDPVSHKLLAFLVNGGDSPRFSCVDFVHYLYDKYEPEFTNQFHREKWDLYYFSESQVQEGDVIGLAIKDETTSNLVHFAISLGHGLYVSVGGVKGPLMVTNLKELEGMYKTNAIFILKPKLK